MPGLVRLEDPPAFAEVPSEVLQGWESGGVRIEALDPEAPRPQAGLLLQGHVLTTEENTSLVSCGGLLARVRGHPHAPHVRIHVRQRA